MERFGLGSALNFDGILIIYLFKLFYVCLNFSFLSMTINTWNLVSVGEHKLILGFLFRLEDLEFLSCLIVSITFGLGSIFNSIARNRCAMFLVVSARFERFIFEFECSAEQPHNAIPQIMTTLPKFRLTCLGCPKVIGTTLYQQLEELSVGGLLTRSRLPVLDQLEQILHI